MISLKTVESIKYQPWFISAKVFEDEVVVKARTSGSWHGSETRVLRTAAELTDFMLSVAGRFEIQPALAEH